MECVVCKVRVNKLPEHLQSHTKQQIVNALLRSEQSNARSSNAEGPVPASSGCNQSEPHAGPSGLSGNTVSFSNPNHLQNFSHHNQLGNVRLENVMETRRENHDRGSGEGPSGDGSQMIRNNVNRLNPRGIATVSGGMATLSQVVPGAGQAWNLADGSNLPPPLNEPRVFPGTTRGIPSIQLVEPGINMASIANGYPANAINIQRTLNNVNIVNNIGTAQMITSTPGILNGHGQQIQGFGGAFIANPTMIGNVMMLGGFLQGSANNGSQPTAFPMLTTATPILMPQVNGPTLLLNIPTAVSSAGASFTMPQQQQQQQQQFVMFKPADVVQQNVASSSFSTTTTRAVVAPSVNSCVSLPTQPASSSRISHPLLPNYGLNETKLDESKPEVETRPVQGPSSSELRVERNINASQQYADKSPGENNTEHDDLDDENLEEAYNHEDVEVVENPGPSVSRQRIYNFTESSVSGDQAGMAPVVTLPSVSASYSMASAFTERSGNIEEVLIKQKNNTAEQNEASSSRREAHLDNPIPGTSRQKTEPVHPTSSKQYVISQVDSSRVIKLSHKVECEAIAECLDEDEKDVVFVDDENESEDEEILLDESSDEEQPSVNVQVTTHNNSNNSANNLISHRKNKSTSEWAMENLRLQQSSAAAAASATISNVAAASSSVRNSFENAARKRYTDTLSNVYENPKALENAVVHDYSRQGTSRMTATRSRHDALVIEDNNVNNQQTMESNRESSSVIVSPNSMSHMSENAAAEVAGSSHATASSSKHNSRLRTSNSSRVSAEVSGSMVANGSCDSKQVEAVPLVSCEPSRTADDVEVVAAISPRIETHDFNSDEQVRSPITIHTVEELQNALASDKNVQLVVSNELLDTPEFKALIQNMQETNIPEDIISDSYDGTRSTTIAASSMGGEDTRSIPGPSTTNSIEVSRETTRDGFDPFDAESSQSLTLTTSSSISQAQQHSAVADKQELSFSNLQQNDNYILSTVSDDDDITLQDLIAVESIEDSQMSDDGAAVTHSAVGSRLSWQRTEQPVAATSSRTEHLQPEVLSVAGCSKSQDSCSNCGVFFNSWIDRQNHLCTQMKQDLRIKMFDRRQQIQNNSALKNHHEKRIIMDNSDDNALDLSSSSVVMAKKSSIANLSTTYTTVATAAATTSIASSSSGGGASRFDKVNIATKIEMMLSDDESNPDNELDDHDDTMDEDCDTEDDSYVEALVKKEAGLDNKTQRLDNKTPGLDIKTRGLDNSAAQRQELDNSAQDPEVLDNRTQSPDNKAPIIKLVNTKFTVATQDPLAMPGNHWKCQHCKVIFPSSDQLIIHRQMFMSKAEDNFIKCIPCHVRFQERTELVNHVSTVHNFQNIPDNSIVFDPVPLGDPKEVAPTAEGGIANLKLEAIDLEDSKFFVPNQNREYSCSWCDRAFKEASQLKKHLSCHLSEKPFECLQCGKRFMKMIHLKRHSLIHNEKKAYQCVLCYKGFHTASKLREHMRMHTGEAPLKCDLCDKWFKRHSNLSSHRKTHYPDKKEKPQKEIFCKDCGDMFTTKRDLVWHYEKKHNKVPNKCKECGEVFIHARSLTRHIRLKHDHNFVPKEIKVSNYAKCPICDLLFFKTSINKHIKVVHHNIRQFQCDICQKSFVSKHNLDTHVWQHKNKRARPWKCTKCNKAYLRESLLKEHMNSHKINKPYVCNECGVQFSMRHNWKRHVEEHEGRRTYNCPECNKTFARSYYLADHLKVHSGEKPYLCGICGKSTATRSNYNSHLKTHTTREPVNSEI